MAVIHIVSLSELRIADTAPKPHTGKQNYRRLRKTLKNAGDLGGRTKSTCVSRSVRTRARVREAERGICRHSERLIKRAVRANVNVCFSPFLLKAIRVRVPSLAKLLGWHA